MQNCNICEATLDELVAYPFESPEKTWLTITPCCNKFVCFKCLLKSSTVQCLMCPNQTILSTLPLAVIHLSNIKLTPVSID